MIVEAPTENSSKKPEIYPFIGEAGYSSCEPIVVEFMDRSTEKKFRVHFDFPNVSECDGYKNNPGSKVDSLFENGKGTTLVEKVANVSMQRNENDCSKTNSCKEIKKIPAYTESGNWVSSEMNKIYMRDGEHLYTAISHPCASITGTDENGKPIRFKFEDAECESYRLANKPKAATAIAMDARKEFSNIIKTNKKVNKGRGARIFVADKDCFLVDNETV